MYGGGGGVCLLYVHFLSARFFVCVVVGFLVFGAVNSARWLVS